MCGVLEGDRQGKGRGGENTGKVGMDVWMCGCMDVRMYGWMYVCR